MKAISHTISFVFHPIFALIYVLLILLLVNPFLFGYRSVWDARDLLMYNFILVVPIPIIAVLLLRALGFAKTIFLHSREERIGPYLITAIVYLSLYVQLSRSQTTEVYQAAVLGALITIFTGFFINNFVKISMHAAAASGIVAFTGVLITKFSEPGFELYLGQSLGYSIPTAVLLATTIIIAGMVGTARCYLKEHTINQVYSGFVLGILAQLIAFNIVI